MLEMWAQAGMENALGDYWKVPRQLSWRTLNWNREPHRDRYLGGCIRLSCS